MFHLKLFGGVTLSGPSGPLTGRAVQRHRLGLLAMLGATSSPGLTRDKLVTYLWPDADAERARALLSDSIYRINQALGGEAILSVGDMVRLNSERVISDVAEFRKAIGAAEWQRAVELQNAPFLDGFYLPDAEEFERWSEAERQRLGQEKLNALENLADSSADPLAAARWWRQLAAESPYSSRIALALMRALDDAGERAAAIRHAQVHTGLMHSELGLDPDPEVIALAERLRAEPSRRTSASPPALELPAMSPEVVVPENIDATRLPRRPKWIVAGTAVLLVAVVLGIAAIIGSDASSNPGDGATSIVVLPFADHSPARDKEYLGDGIAEDLMVRLADVPGVDVVGRTSAFAFKGRSVDAREIARKLGVDAVLSGSVRVAGEQMRITVQLVDATTGFEMWSETYDRAPSGVLGIQTEIASAIAARLNGPAKQPVAAAQLVIDDAEAYNLYLRGRFEWHKRTEAGMRAAVTHFTHAIERAPGYARAHAGLGDAYAVLGFYDYLPPRIAFPSAKRAALRALELDPTLAEPHNTLGYVALYYEWQWPRAEEEFRRSIDLDARYSTAHQWYGNFLTAMGRFDEAVREMRLAQDIDPLSLIANAALGWTWYFAGEYEKAIAQLDKTLELNPGFELAHLWRGQALLELNRITEAKQAIERAVKLSGGSAVSTAALAHVQAVAGELASARSLLAMLEQPEGATYTPAYEIAKIHLASGDTRSAIHWLQRAHKERSHSMAFLMVDPQLKRLRGDAEFRQIVSAVGLDD